jgi:hypothetical protein
MARRTAMRQQGKSRKNVRPLKALILDERVVAEAGKTAYDFLKQDGKRPQQQ